MLASLASLRRSFFPHWKESQTDVDAVAGHLARTFLNASTARDPWPYVFVEKVFPKDFYARVFDAFTLSEEHFKDQVHKGDRKVFYSSYEDRQEFRVARAGPEAGKNIPPIWLDVYDVFTSDVFLDVLRMKFIEGYRRRFGDFAAHSRFNEFLDPTLLITRHRENYYLGPHTDRREKVVTCIFNFAENNNQQDIGTAVYVPKESGFTSDGYIHHNPVLFTRVHTVPFRQNSAMIFLRTDTSFHGVERLTAKNMKGSQRRNVQFNLWDWNRRP